MNDDICMCQGCRRMDWPNELTASIKWTGDCFCLGQDWDCWSKVDNWEMRCPACGNSCSGSYAPSIDGTGYGHIVWACNWAPCGWWWG